MFFPNVLVLLWYCLFSLLEHIKVKLQLLNEWVLDYTDQEYIYIHILS